MKWHNTFICGLLLTLLGGCATGYKTATVDAGSIRNPSMGWNGYSIEVPDGYPVFDPVQMDISGSSNKDAFRRVFLEAEKESMKKATRNMVESLEI